MSLSQQTVKRIARHRRQPKYSVLLTTLQKDFNIRLFTEETYEIGRGGFGRCYLGKICSENGQIFPPANSQSDYETFIQDKNIVVVKMVPKQNSKSFNEEEYSQEINNLASLHRDRSEKQCENIVKIYPYKLVSDRNYYIVMEYCYHSSLAELMESRKRRKHRFNFGQFLMIVKNILTGYGVLHSKNILHNDLKPHNIFIKDKIFKIGDFGISTRLSSFSQRVVTSHCSYLYSSIEKLQQNSINHKADIYSIGVMLAQILFGQHPFFDKKSWQQYYKLKLMQERQNQGIIDLDQIEEPLQIDLQQKKMRKSNNIFLLYLKCRSRFPINLPVAIDYNPEDADFLIEIKNLIISMCNPQNKRPTLQQINYSISQFKLFSTIALKYQKFKDLHKLKSSELLFQTENLHNLAYSLIDKQSLKASEKIFNLKASEKIDQLRKRLKQTTNFVKLFFLITSSLSTFGEHDNPKIRLLKLHIYHYLYEVNQKEFIIVSEEISKLSAQELGELYAQNISKLMRINRIDSQQLTEMINIDFDGNELQERRKSVLYMLESNFLKNASISKENFHEMYLFFIAFELIKIESQYQLSRNTEKFASELQNICNLLPKLQDEDIDLNKLFKRWEKMIVYQF